MAGCAIVGPNYKAPAIGLAPEFTSGGSKALLDAASDQWWRRLNVPLLDKLIIRGSAQSLDVLSAIERITAANAVLGQTGLNSQTNGTLVSGAQRQGSEGTVETTTNTAINAGYVIDLFGGFARGQERSIANLEAAQLEVGKIRLAYLADLTNSYLQARYNQEAAAITRQTIACRRQTLAIVVQRRAVEDASELEVQQARSLLASAQAPLLVANFEINVFRTSTLLAEPAALLLERMQAGARQPRPTGFTRVG